MGIKLTPRVKDVIDMCWRKNVVDASKLSKGPASKFHTYTPEKGLQMDMKKLAENRFVDVSQNVDRSGLKEGMKTLTSNSEYYSFEHDRGILAKEHFRVLMHSKLNFGDLADGPIRELAGHSLSMPNGALLCTALLLASSFSGLWELEPAPSSYK